MINLMVKLIVSCVVILSFTQNYVWACPANPPLPGAIKLLEGEAPTGPVDSSKVTIEIDGYTALGSGVGDSCGAASKLPDGLTPTAVSIVHSETGEQIGFGEFRVDAMATRGFCGANRSNCIAFVSKVGKYGIKEGTPMKLVIDAIVDEVLDTRKITEIAGNLTRAGTIIAGGIDENGMPHHHLSVFNPNSVQVVFHKNHEKTERKNY